MCSTTYIASMLSAMTTPYNRLFRTSASDWWHEQFDLILPTHLACISMEPIHFQLGRSGPSRLGNPAFAPSQIWSLCRRTSEESSLTNWMLKPYLSMVDWLEVMLKVTTIKGKRYNHMVYSKCDLAESNTTWVDRFKILLNVATIKKKLRSSVLFEIWSYWRNLE